MRPPPMKIAAGLSRAMPATSARRAGASADSRRVKRVSPYTTNVTLPPGAATLNRGGPSAAGSGRHGVLRPQARRALRSHALRSIAVSGARLELARVRAAPVRGLAGDAERRHLLCGGIEAAAVRVDEFAAGEQRRLGESRPDGLDLAGVAGGDALRVEAQLAARPRERVAILHAQVEQSTVVADGGGEPGARARRLRDRSLGRQ